MRMLFASMHGSAATEIGLLCNGAGVEMWVPERGFHLLDTLVKPEDASYLAPLGVKIAGYEEAEDALAGGAFDAVMLSTPGQIRQFRENVAPLARVPFVVRHGLNSFDKFRELGTRNFLSPSRRGLGMMPECHGFLMRKLVPWAGWPPADTYAKDREGFCSFIHHYPRQWPGAWARFGELQELTGGAVEWYGRGSPLGAVDDIGRMKRARGTVHIKDGQVACNCVVRSMSVGTPVLMDRATYERCYFDCIDGIVVRDTPEELASEMAALGDDEYLEEACDEVFLRAKRQFTYTEELGDSFVKFLGSLR